MSLKRDNFALLAIPGSLRLAYTSATPMPMDVEIPGDALFRPAKRRKFQRLRTELGSPDSEDAAGADDLASDGPALTQILKQRKANRNRHHGIEYSTAKANAEMNSTMPENSTMIEPQAERLKSISDRFVGHTGQVVDVDRHMFVQPLKTHNFYRYGTLTNVIRMAFIDSEMAKRRLGENIATSAPINDSIHTAGSDSDDYDDSTKGKRLPQRHPASIGKIHEIDLGADASLRNAKRTEIAILRAQNGEPLPNPDDKPVKPRKPRLGRDGKLIKPRVRKRRNSEDIKRDQLVEQVLRESRLEIYDEPVEAKPGDTDNGEGNTDEKIAEQFRQDFMDAMESRQRKRTAGQPKMPVGKPGEVGPKGPKLGGSRSARAAMRERELAEQQKAKK